MLCACVLCVILLTGLWPFNAPKNYVDWLKGENGLRFGHHGIAVSVNAFSMASGDGACSLEIWLEPGRMDHSGTILAFDSSPDSKFSFALRQFGDGLAIQRASADARGTMVRPWLKTDQVFENGKPVFLTITGKQKRTSVYVNGLPVKISSGFGFVNGDLTGRLVLGNSTIKDSWSGQIMGLAVYDFALAPSQVAAHVERWTQGQVRGVSGEKPPVALYSFDERKGSVVHDKMSSAHDLVIPARYFVLHPAFLHPAWDEFRTRWDGWMSRSYWSDVALNIAGFIPLGFFFTAYCSLVRPIPRPQVMVVLFGLAISLTIEILQYFLPTRDSSMTDVITNTFGTMVGVAFYRSVSIRRLLARPFVVGISHWLWNSPRLKSRPAEADISRTI
jgi:hypothetical protein